MALNQCWLREQSTCLDGKAPIFLLQLVESRLKVLLVTLFWWYIASVLKQELNSWPLTADKYASWINKLAPKSELINIFLDYETFGEHNWKETGIFDFLSHMPGAVWKNSFQVYDNNWDCRHVAAGICNKHSISHIVGWWRARHNRMAREWVAGCCLDKLYSLAGKVNKCEDELIKKDWSTCNPVTIFITWLQILLRRCSTRLFQPVWNTLRRIYELYECAQRLWDKVSKTISWYSWTRSDI